ncbi:MAG: hypothetical protein AAB515_01630 [Patescibacteria group bacterium]
MQAFLQLLGGGCYLLNKIFLSISERKTKSGKIHSARTLRIAAWAVYLVGLPPWVIILIHSHNWIVASVEASGAPAMVLGLIMAIRGQGSKPPRWLNHLAFACIPIGFAVSLYDFGGITTLNQCLEISLVAGFLLGTYQLALQRHSGYLWYLLMHVAGCWLMWIQNYPWLCAQQAISLLFILDAYRVASRRQDS